MNGAGDECTVAAGISEPSEVFGSTNPPAGQEREPGHRVAHARDERKIESRAGADTREVNHDDGAHTGVGRSPGNNVSRLVGGGFINDSGSHNRFPVAQIETERHAVAADRGADLCERAV